MVIQAEGYLPTEHWVQVAPDQVVRLNEKLIPVGGHIPEGQEAAVATAKKNGAAEEKHGFSLPVATWVTLAVSAAAFGTGLGLGVEADGFDHNADSSTATASSSGSRAPRLSTGRPMPPWEIFSTPGQARRWWRPSSSPSWCRGRPPSPPRRPLRLPPLRRRCTGASRETGARQAWLAIFFAFAAVSPACRYGVDPDSGKFHCKSDDDCGGGWHCFSSCPASGFSAYCLQDGSCEACPSLQADPLNCGTCGTACASGDECIDGVCVLTALPDGGLDAEVDGGNDAGQDGGGDGGLVDGGHPDGSVDAGRDAGEPDGSVRRG